MGRSGQKYDFTVCPLSTRFRAVGAVYSVTKRSYENKTYKQSGSHEHIFIGETGDLSVPIATQAQLDRFYKNGANCICVHMVADAEQRLVTTRDLCAGNRTHYNL